MFSLCRKHRIYYASQFLLRLLYPIPQVSQWPSEIQAGPPSLYWLCDKNRRHFFFLAHSTELCSKDWRIFFVAFRSQKWRRTTRASLPWWPWKKFFFRVYYCLYSSRATRWLLLPLWRIHCKVKAEMLCCVISCFSYTTQRSKFCWWFSKHHQWFSYFVMKYMCLACETRDFVDIFKSFQTGLLLSPKGKIARAKRARIHGIGHFSWTFGFTLGQNPTFYSEITENLMLEKCEFSEI